MILRSTLSSSRSIPLATARPILLEPHEFQKKLAQLPRQVSVELCAQNTLLHAMGCIAGQGSDLPFPLMEIKRIRCGVRWISKAFDWIKYETDRTGTGVLDIIPKTNFPDVRKNCVIRSVRHGNLMLIPREKKIVRFYVQLLHANLDEDLSLVKSAYSVGALLKAAQRVLSPYELTYEHCDWWSVYQVGQRVSEKFSIHDRLFLAGDAVRKSSFKPFRTQMLFVYNLLLYFLD